MHYTSVALVGTEPSTDLRPRVNQVKQGVVFLTISAITFSKIAVAARDLHQTKPVSVEFPVLGLTVAVF